MNRKFKILLLFVCMVPLIGIEGCGEKTSPPKKVKSVSKKIPIQSNASTPAPQADKSGSGSGGGAVIPSEDGKAMRPQTAPADGEGAEIATSDADAGGISTSDLVQASLKIASSYDPKGRFDPFEPLFKEKEEPVIKDDGKKRREIPSTPLTRVALSQLKVTAIIRASTGNRALVADATGKGYVVRKGTYIGLNAGQVIAIEKDRIVIEEEIENLLGELTIKNAELKLQKPAGEL